MLRLEEAEEAIRRMAGGEPLPLSPMGLAMAPAIALTTLSFWGLFAVGVYFDLYLMHLLLGTILKSLLPIAVLSNIAGLVVGVISLARRRNRRGRSVLVIVLNALPLLAIGSVLYWWIFLLKM